MLDLLRKAAATWIVKLLLLLLVLSFAAWGVSGQLTDVVGRQPVVQAGNTSVSATEYRLAYDRQIAQMSQQMGQRLTRDQAKAFGVDGMVVGSLVSGAVLDEQASKLGLGLSKDRIAALTAEDPAFKGVGGQFDRKQFDYVLRQIGMQPQEYFDSRANVAIRQQIVEAVSDGVKAPDVFLRAAVQYRGEDRTVDYVVLPQSLVPAIQAPTDDVLAKWFETNKAKYTAPEYRKIIYAKLDPEDIMDLAAVTDKQVADDYEARKSSFGTPETRAIEQLVFADEAAAKAALESIRGGKTFEDAVKAAGKTPADTQLGTLSKDKIADKAVAEAAFKLSANQVSDVVAGAFGPVLLRVTAITPAVVKPLAEVKDEIRKNIALSEANRVLLDVHSSYEDARAGGESLPEAAEKLKLKVVTVDAVDRQSRRPDGTVLDNLPVSAELLSAAFEASAKTENQPLNTDANGYVYFEVESVTPARDRKLDEIKEKVTADWKTEQLSQQLEARAAGIEKRIKDGTDLQALATELKIEKQTKRGLKRDAEDTDLGKAGVGAVFGVAQKQAGSFVAPDGTSRIVFKVTDVVEPASADASALPEDQRNNIADAMGNDLLDQLVQRLRGEYDVEVNQTAIEQALNF